MAGWKNNRFPLWMTTALVGFVFGVAPHSAQAQNAEYVDELVDDFDDGTWQDCLWQPYQRTGGNVEYFDWDGSEGNQIRVDSSGRLEMQVNAGERPGQSWELGLESKFILAGDFDVRVDYEFSHTNYWANLDMRGINMLFVELMAGDQGTRRRHVRSLDIGAENDVGTTSAHLWLSNPGHNKVTQIDTDNRQFLREIDVGVRPARTAVDLLGNVYVHNRGNNGGNTTVTFIKASACPDPDCDLSNEPDHVYTLDFSGNEFGNFGWNGLYGGGVAVDRNNDLWVAFREHPENLYYLKYHPSDTPGGDTWTLEDSWNLSQMTGTTARAYGMAFARDGTLWIASRGGSAGFYRFNPLTEQATFFPPPATALTNGCLSTYGMAIDAEQRLFLATFAGGNCRGFRFDPSVGGNNGWITMEMNGPGVTADQQNARGLAVDAQGRVWLAGDNRSKLIAFDVETAESVFITNTCSNPAGVALDRNNLLWVSCRGGHQSDRVRYYNMDGDLLGNVPAKSTYTYSDMTGYQLRNFGLEDWEESFLVGQDELVGAYYRANVENNYGGGIESGVGGDTILDPNQAPFVMHPGLASAAEGPVARRIRVGDRYYTDKVPRIIEQPGRLEGVWGFQTPSTADLEDFPFQFTVTEEAYVYVAFEAGANPVPQWLRASNGWTTTNEIVQTTDTSRNYRLYRKNFLAGEEVILENTNAYQGSVPAGAPFENYFVYVYPRSFDGQDPQNPQAYIGDTGNDVDRRGTLRISREGTVWTYSWQDSTTAGWRSRENPAGPVGNVPIKLRTRLDPFWHGGPQSNPGGSLSFRFDNFEVIDVAGIPGAPYCREGCDDSVPGYGSSCFGGEFEECPGVFDCVDDVLTCVPEVQTERCNGLDNDCDGWVDHNADGFDFPAQLVSFDGQFQMVEDFGMPGAGPDTGQDVNEGNMCASGLLGPCAQGYWECVAGAMQCQPFRSPQPEQCNGIDNSCDGTPNVDASEPLNQLGRHVMVSQRSTPSNPMRPLVPESGESFSAFAGVNGSTVNPVKPGLLEESQARVMLYLDPTYTGPGAHDELGAYVLWLSHGANTGGQDASEAFYTLDYGSNSYVPFGAPVAQTGIVKMSSITTVGAEADQALQQTFTIQSPPGQSGGVAIGPLPATDEWQIKLSSYFSGDIDGWEIYNAVTGRTSTLSANEPLLLSNNANDDFFGPLTVEVGTNCVTGQPGICGAGSSRCVESDGEWSMECLASVTPQVEVCDGRDNSCSGEVDFDAAYGFVVPMVEWAEVGKNYFQEPTLNENQWNPIPTVDRTNSAYDFLNFTERETYSSGTVGSSEILDVMDPTETRTIQDRNRSVFTFHRDIRQGNGTLAMVMAHGKHQRQPADPVPTQRAAAQVTFQHWDARENFVAWIDDLEDQEDGTNFTAADVMQKLTDDFEVWTSEDIGTNFGGEARAENGVYTVTGGGGDIWGGSDDFHYAYQYLPGDGVITARVNITDNPGGNEWAKAGLMMRNFLTDDSGHVFLMNSPGNGTRVQGRIQGQSSSYDLDANDSEWLRLEREGNEVKAFTSPDGSTWSLQQTRSLTGSGGGVYVGLAVSSHEASTSTTATFSDVSGFGGAYLAGGIPADIPEGPGYFFNWNLHRWGPGGSAQREADSGIINDLFNERTDFEPATMVFSIDTEGDINKWRLYEPSTSGDDLSNLSMSKNLAVRVRPGKALGDADERPTCVIQNNEVVDCIGQENTYTCIDGALLCGTGFGCCSPDDPFIGEPCDNPENLEDYVPFIDEENPNWRDEDGNIIWQNIGACRAEYTCSANGTPVCRIVQGPEKEVCDGIDNTCDGIVDGIDMWETEEGEVRGPSIIGEPAGSCTSSAQCSEGYSCLRGECHEITTDTCPDGVDTCGPQECGFQFVCACDDRHLLEGNDYCLCIDALSEYMTPYERFCENYERFENGECVAVGSVLPE